MRLKEGRGSRVSGPNSNHCLETTINRPLVNKGFLQSEVLGDVCVLEWGAVWGEVFGEVWGEVYGLVLLGDTEQEKLQQKLQPKISMALQSKADENTGRNFMMRFGGGPPPTLGVCSWSQGNTTKRADLGVYSRINISGRSKPGGKGKG